MSKNRLTRLEERIERLIEGGFSRLFAGHLHPRQVAIQLARAMEDHARTDLGHPTAPDVYTVYVHPTDHAALLAAQPDMARALGTHLVDLAARSGMRMNRFPTVHLAPSVTVRRQEVRVEAEHGAGPTRQTEMAAPAASGPAPPANARLIIEGVRVLLLDKPAVNIGRRLDNDVVIDNRRVSRRHAQIRLRQGRYVLFDLGSSHGTEVNGQRVEACILQAGDQVSFGGVLARYEEDPGDPGGPQDTQLYDVSD